MTVHSLHIFDRRGKTLFTKNYSPISQQIPANVDDEEEYLAEKRKLIFGMLFSLRELTGSLGPEGVVPGECRGQTRNALYTVRLCGHSSRSYLYGFTMLLYYVILCLCVCAQRYFLYGLVQQLFITMRHEVGLGLQCTRTTMFHRRLLERVRRLNIPRYGMLYNIFIPRYG